MLIADVGSGTDGPRPHALPLMGQAVDALLSGLLRPIIRAAWRFFHAEVTTSAPRTAAAAPVTKRDAPLRKPSTNNRSNPCSTMVVIFGTRRDRDAP